MLSLYIFRLLRMEGEFNPFSPNEITKYQYAVHTVSSLVNFAGKFVYLFTFQSIFSSNQQAATYKPLIIRINTQLYNKYAILQ